jgi:hypothetical protein
LVPRCVWYFSLCCSSKIMIFFVGLPHCLFFIPCSSECVIFFLILYFWFMYVLVYRLAFFFLYGYIDNICITCLLFLASCHHIY